MQHDKLPWREKIPLGLALLAQSYVVFLWYAGSIQGMARWLDLVVAVAAGVALDLIVVTTTMGRREGRSSVWSWLTSLGAFVGSAAIALDHYDGAWLHIAFPAVVFLYSQHLALPRATGAPVARHDAPEQHHGAPLVSIQQVVAPPLAQMAHREALPFDEAAALEAPALSPEERMARAVDAVLQHRTSIKSMARQWEVPESTLARRVKAVKEGQSHG